MVKYIVQKMTNKSSLKANDLFVLNKSANVVYQCIINEDKTTAVEAYIKPNFSKDKFYKVDKGNTKTITNLFIYPVKKSK